MKFKQYLNEVATSTISYKVLTYDGLVSHLKNGSFKDIIGRLKYVNGDQSEYSMVDHIIYIAAFSFCNWAF